MGFFDKAKEAYKQKQDEKARLAANEEARKQELLNGELVPITVATDLLPNEVAYLELTARRMALVNSVIQETLGKSKKKHVVGRAVAGGVLLGPLGAVAGAATAGSKQSATTTEKTVSTTRLIDSGKVVFTNQRFIFSGNNGITALPYAELTVTGFNGNVINIKYANMLSGEHYEVFGDGVKDIELYYKGIMQHKLMQPSKPTATALSAQTSVADELTKLAMLKRDGILTQAEFDKKKAELLA